MNAAKTTAAKTTESITTETGLVRVEQATLRHGRRANAVTALQPTTLALHVGERVAVVGRSGAGKSSLADIILGLRRPTAGRVLLDGQLWTSAHKDPPRGLRHLIQGVPQDALASFPPRWTIRRTLTHARTRLRGAADPDAVDKAAQAARLDPALLDRRPGELSGGQAQRAAIARALIADPRVIVADEPTSALDDATAAEVTTELATLSSERGTTLILITHDPSLAAWCDRVLTVHDGHVSDSESTA